MCAVHNHLVFVFRITPFQVPDDVGNLQAGFLNPCLYRNLFVRNKKGSGFKFTVNLILQVCQCFARSLQQMFCHLPSCHDQFGSNSGNHIHLSRFILPLHFYRFAKERSESGLFIQEIIILAVRGVNVDHRFCSGTLGSHQLIKEPVIARYGHVLNPGIALFIQWCSIHDNHDLVRYIYPGILIKLLTG